MRRLGGRRARTGRESGDRNGDRSRGQDCGKSCTAVPTLRRGDLAVDLARHRASRSHRPLSLTRKEFGILEMLLAAGGAVVSAEELLEHVWDAHADPFSNIVSVTMTRLRRKLGDPPLIETVVGKGYRM
jgi:DNA-binding response OmpR family regulator